MKNLVYVLVLIVGFGFGMFYQSSRNINVETLAISPNAGNAIATKFPEKHSNKELDSRDLIKSLPSPKDPLEDSISMKARFDQLYQKQNFSEAATLLDQMQKQWPQSLQYLEGRSRLLVRTRDWEKAKEVLKQCVSLYPNSKSCLLDLGSTELQVGSKEEQQTAIQNCNDRLSQNPECRNMLGNLRINQGRFLEAEGIYKQLIKDNGSYGIRFDEGMLNSQIAIALNGEGRQDEAEAYFKKACQLNWSNACERLRSF